MPLPTPLFAYFGPETLLPVASVLAGAVGVIMICGRNTLRFFGRCFRLFVRR